MKRIKIAAFAAFWGVGLAWAIWVYNPPPPTPVHCPEEYPPPAMVCNINTKYHDVLSPEVP